VNVTLNLLNVPAEALEVLHRLDLPADRSRRVDDRLIPGDTDDSDSLTFPAVSTFPPSVQIPCQGHRRTVVDSRLNTALRTQFTAKHRVGTKMLIDHTAEPRLSVLRATVKAALNHPVPGALQRAHKRVAGQEALHL